MAAYFLPSPVQNMRVSIVALSIIDDRKKPTSFKEGCQLLLQEEIVT